MAQLCPTKWLFKTDISNYLFPEKNANQRGYYDPDWDYFHKELLKKNVTLKLLHKENLQELTDEITN